MSDENLSEYGVFRNEADEQQVLLEIDSDRTSSSIDSTSSIKSNFTKFIVLIALLVISSIAYNFSGAAKSYFSQTETFFSDDSLSYEIAVSVTSPGYDSLDSLQSLPWDAIAEPYRTQIISVSSFTVDNEEEDISSIESNYEIEWIINGVEYFGQNVEFIIESTGVVNCTVTLSPIESSHRYYGNLYKSGNSLTTSKRKLTPNYNPSVYTSSLSDVFSLEFTMAAKYIRRDIYTLTDSDRTLLLDTMRLLYDYNESYGQSIYGGKYHSAEYFAVKHLYGAGTSDCDHWHDGGGIVVYHVGTTLQYEQALQSVNKSIALPYWEYTKDNYLYDVPSESIFFDKDWMGEMSPTNSLYVLDDDSRWAGLSLNSGDPYRDWTASNGINSLNPYVNGLGYLSSPWNNNPTPKLSRHNKTYDLGAIDSWPTCSTMYEAFTQDNLICLNYYLDGVTHGGVHILLGGTWGAVNQTYMIDFNRLVTFKILWRNGWTRCPTECSPFESCRCSVPQEFLDEFGAEYIIKASNLAGSISLVQDNDWEGLLTAIEDPGVVGDIFTSNAAWDPLFWPLHGPIERILGFKRIAASSGEVWFDESWGYPLQRAEAAFLGTCDWSNIESADDLTMPTCNTTGLCYHHGENDPTIFSNFMDLNENYTNIELYTFVHPWNDDLPYVFDTYTYDYCGSYDTVNFYDGFSTSSLVYNGVSKPVSVPPSHGVDPNGPGNNGGVSRVNIPLIHDMKSSNHEVVSSLPL